jgi:hypothetical protein
MLPMGIAGGYYLPDLVKRKIAKTYSSIHDEITALRVWPVAIRGAYPETAAKGVKYYGNDIRS